MANGGGSSGQTSTVNDKVKANADTLVGQNSVGDGECFALADKTLKDAGAKSAADFGAVTADADYVWGTQVADLKLVQPGDILQFRNHEVEVKTTTTTVKTYADGTVETQDAEDVQTYKRGHHTAVVSAAPGAGTLTIVEQHVMDRSTGALSKVVRQNQLITSGSTTPATTTVTSEKGPDGKAVKVETTTTVKTTVKGTIKAYHPVQK
jgi:hypothetical protein